MKSTSIPSSQTDSSNEAAQAAKAKLSQACKRFLEMDRRGQAVVAGSVIAVLATFVFDMLSFRISSSKPVTPTMAEEMRRMEGVLNGAAYSAFTSTLWGKLLAISGLGAAGLVVWGFLTNQRAAWVPMAIVGAAVASVGCLLLIGLTGAPSAGLFAGNASYLRPDIDLTLLGYWLPFACRRRRRSGCCETHRRVDFSLRLQSLLPHAQTEVYATL